MHPKQTLLQKTDFWDFPTYIPIVKSVSLGGAFQMSYIDSKNCSEHLMTNEMGLDRAPVEFQKIVFFGLVVNHFTKQPQPPTALQYSNTFEILTKTGMYIGRFGKIQFTFWTADICFLQDCHTLQAAAFLTLMLHSSTFRALWGKENNEL